MRATHNFFIKHAIKYPFPSNDMEFHSHKANEITAKLINSDEEYLIKADAQLIINKIDLSRAVPSMFKELPNNIVLKFYSTTDSPYRDQLLDFTMTVKREDNFLYIFEGMGNDELISLENSLFNKLLFMDIDTGLIAEFGAVGTNTQNYPIADTKRMAAVDFTNQSQLNIYKILTYVFLSDVKIVVLPVKASTNVFNKIIGAVTNDHTTKLNIVTAKWNTVIFHAGEFGVSGHFRLQPYGPDRRLRKLIYIAPFIKHGYTSRRHNPDLITT